MIIYFGQIWTEFTFPSLDGTNPTGCRKTSSERDISFTVSRDWLRVLKRHEKQCGQLITRYHVREHSQREFEFCHPVGLCP